jgi:hypothetical protein
MQESNTKKVVVDNNPTFHLMFQQCYKNVVFDNHRGGFIKAFRSKKSFCEMLKTRTRRPHHKKALLGRLTLNRFPSAKPDSFLWCCLDKTGKAVQIAVVLDEGKIVAYAISAFRKPKK